MRRYIVVPAVYLIFSLVIGIGWTSASEFNGDHPVFRCAQAVLAPLLPQPDWTLIRETHASMAPRAPMEYNVGDTRIFWTWDLSVMPPGYNQTPATCRAKGTFCYVWVADDQWDVEVTQDDVDTILNAWEISSPSGSYDPSKGIYQIASTVFGPVPDELDNDVRINLLFYDVGSFHGTTFDGFFRYFDEMTETEAQSYGEHSNECEILYINSKSLSPVGSDYMLGVISHEFQHLIHWGADPNEATWVNEGCSQLSWYLCGYGTDGAENSFANQPNDDLTSWDQGNVDYGQVTMFFVYLFEQFGGAEAIGTIVAESANGFAGIGNAVASLGYHWDTYRVFDNWVMANFINDPSLDHGQYGYHTFQAPSFRRTTSFSTYPTGDQNEDVAAWAARCYRFNNVDQQLNTTFIPDSEALNGYLLIKNDTNNRVIPIDPGYQSIQTPADTSAVFDFVAVNHDSATSPADFTLSATDTASTDDTPPYVQSSLPWGINITEVTGHVKLTDELSRIDRGDIVVTLNGETIEHTTSPAGNTSTDVFFSLRGLSAESEVHVTITASDTEGHTMTPFHYYFRMGNTPPIELGVRLNMPAHLFFPGDPCYLSAYLGNPNTPLTGMRVFIVLDVFGAYYLAPDWVNAEDGISYYVTDIPTGETRMEVLPEFEWPDGVGTAENIYFYGGMTDQSMSELVGNMDIWQFGWSE